MNFARPTIYSDFICPFCYVGKIHVERLRQAYPDLEIEWREFELHPHGQPDPASEYMRRAQTATIALARRYRIGMRPEVLTTVTSNSRKAMLGLAFAKAHGRADAYRDAVFAAYWIDAQDIGDLDVLVGIASKLGLERRVFRAAIEQELALPALRAAMDAARREGITGVPTFVYGEHRSVGAQPMELLRALIAAPAVASAGASA
ncbi:MAG: DsbA family protein [Gammaproteobacteria bacterium]|nr:DsbA family protein [Gammaproteobacteria bacterium]